MNSMFGKSDIENYFKAEKSESLLFMVIGGIAMLAAAGCFFLMAHAFYKGASIPFLSVGALLFVVGLTVYRRSDADRIRNVYAFDMNPQALQEIEWPRMKTVMKNFLIYRWTEIILLLAGLGLYIYFIRDIRNDFWRGFGGSLALMAAIALVADYFAEKRGREYTRGLQSLFNK